MIDDRAGHQVGEEGDEERVIDEAIVFRVASVGVDEEGDLGEREEADSEGQPMTERAAVLERAEDRQVESYGEREQTSTTAERPLCHCQSCHPFAEGVVQDHADDEHGEVAGVPPTVKNERCEQEPVSGQEWVPGGREVEANPEREGQEEEEEFV